MVYRVYKGIHGYIGIYKGIQGYTWVYKGIHKYIGLFIILLVICKFETCFNNAASKAK